MASLLDEYLLNLILARSKSFYLIEHFIENGYPVSEEYIEKYYEAKSCSLIGGIVLLQCAIRCGFMDLFDENYIEEEHYRKILDFAVERDDVYFVDRILVEDQEYVENALIDAVNHDSLKVVKYLIKIYDFDESHLYPDMYGINCNNLEMIKVINDVFADMDWILLNTDDFEVADYVMKYGVNDVGRVLKKLRKFGNNRMVEFIERRLIEEGG